MPEDFNTRVEEEITKQAKTPEQRERLTGLFRAMVNQKPLMPGDERGINMFELSVAFNAAALLVNASNHINVDLISIRSTAVALAKQLFTPEGEFIVNSFFEKKK